MNKPKNNNNRSKKQNDNVDHKSDEFLIKPSLYSTIIETESKLKHVSLSCLESKPVINKVSIFYTST